MVSVSCYKWLGGEVDVEGERCSGGLGMEVEEGGERGNGRPRVSGWERLVTDRGGG